MTTEPARIRDTQRSLLSRIGPSLKRKGSISKNGQTDIDHQTLGKMPRLQLPKDSESPSWKRAEAKVSAPGPSRARGRGGAPSTTRSMSKSTKKDAKPRNGQPALTEPLVDIGYLEDVYKDLDISTSPLGPEWKINPKSALSNFMIQSFNRPPKYEYQEGYIRGQKMFRYV